MLASEPVGGRSRATELPCYYCEPEPVSVPDLGILQRPEHLMFGKNDLGVMSYSFFLKKRTPPPPPPADMLCSVRH